MIDSRAFTRSTISGQSEIFGEEQPSLIPHSSPINKGILFHLINAHIFQIRNNDQLQPLEKKKLIYEFGYKLGQNLVEEQCIGFVKYCGTRGDKNDSKQFVGEMKLLNSKVWNCLVGSKGKLFSVTNQNLKSSSYKIEDKQFALGKAFALLSDPASKNIRELMIQFCQGSVMGTLDKLCLGGQISCTEGTEGSVNVELKNLFKKDSIDKYQQYETSVQTILM